MATRLTTTTTTLFSILIGLAIILVGHHHAAAQEEADEVSIQTCADLIAAIEDTPTAATTSTAATTTTSFNLTSDITCSDYILITSGQNIAITGTAAANTTTTTTTTTITIATEFLANNASQSLLEVQEGGTLTIDGIAFVRQEEYLTSEELLLPVEGIRAIYNMGTLTVNKCIFDGLNSLVVDSLSQGGAIYTNSDENEVLISDSSFTSNFASEKGGAICAVGTDFLTVEGCEFSNNEASVEGAGAGGDIYAISGATLAVRSSTFFGSLAGYGGAAIECCGANITDCEFVAAETVSTDEHYGAVLVGRPRQAECPHELFLSDSSFTNCTVEPSSGAGGSLAVFETSATILDCRFEASQGTAVLFESSRPNGDHTISLTSSLFLNNVEPAEAYARLGVSEGAALVVQNTGLTEEDEAVSMGEFHDFFCFEHKPFECEIVLDLASITLSGEAKCDVCGNSDTSTSEKSSPNYLVIGLVVAYAGSVTFLFGFLVNLFCCQSNETPSAGAQKKKQPETETVAPAAKPVGEQPYVVRPGTTAAGPLPVAKMAPSARSPPVPAPAAQTSPTMVETMPSGGSPPEGEVPTAAKVSPMAEIKPSAIYP